MRSSEKAPTAPFEGLRLIAGGKVNRRPRANDFRVEEDERTRPFIREREEDEETRPFAPAERGTLGAIDDSALVIVDLLERMGEGGSKGKNIPHAGLEELRALPHQRHRERWREVAIGDVGEQVGEWRAHAKETRIKMRKTAEAYAMSFARDGSETEEQLSARAVRQRTGFLREAEELTERAEFVERGIREIGRGEAPNEVFIDTVKRMRNARLDAMRKAKAFADDEPGNELRKNLFAKAAEKAIAFDDLLGQTYELAPKA